MGLKIQSMFFSSGSSAITEAHGLITLSSFHTPFTPKVTAVVQCGVGLITALSGTLSIDI